MNEKEIRNLGEVGSGEMQRAILSAQILILDELRKQGEPRKINKVIKPKRKYTKRAK